MVHEFDPTISVLGEALHESPLATGGRHAGDRFHFFSDEEGVPLRIAADRLTGMPLNPRACLERAGPRRRLFFKSAGTRAAVATCGGLCPGLNDVVRAIVMELTYAYGVEDILGIRYGYAGLVADTECPPIALTPECVGDVHRTGGSFLGASRASIADETLVDRLEALGVSLLFLIGGDGTLRGAHGIAREGLRRGLPLAVVGIPKTIDNDIEMVYRSFGFDTAVGEARHALDCAHNEAKGADRGVGLVKLMGRDSGFVAAQAAAASGDVNLCLIPEIPFTLEGADGILAHLRQRLRQRRHAVVAIAEGAGRSLYENFAEETPQGALLRRDVGLFLRDAIANAFKAWGEPVSLKYIDPSYLIRSVPANSHDSVFCADLGRQAVHAAMAGKTDLMIGRWHGVFTHVPLAAVAGRRKKIDPRGELWQSVVASTGQPTRQVPESPAGSGPT
jgi:6-phosphofructokinase 1